MKNYMNVFYFYLNNFKTNLEPLKTRIMSDSEFAPDYEDPEEEKDHSPPSALKDTKVDKESKKQSGKEEKKEPVKKIKGRGHLAQFEQDDSTKYGGASGNFDTLAAEEKNKHKALKCKL